MKKLGLILGLALVVFNIQAQLDKKYFNQLKTQKVESSDLVEWRQVGPGMAGYCEEFWCHPTDTNTILMSPDMYNSYGSWDGGKSWHTIKDCDGDGKDLPRIRKFTFSLQDPDFGLAITGGGGKVYKTVDRGRIWELIAGLGGRNSELTVDPTNDKIWYAGRGDFWNVKKNHRHQNGQSSKFKNSHIFKSTDKGKTWKKIKISDKTDLDVGRIIVDPTNTKVLIMATNYGVLRSTDSGQTWKTSGKGLPVNRPRDIDSFYDAKSKEFVLYLVDQTAFEPAGKTVKSNGGVFKSTDHGKTWQNISGNLAVDMSQITSKVLRNKYWNSLAFWFQKKPAEVKKLYPNYPKEVYSVFHRIQVNPNNKNEIWISQNNKHDKAFLPSGAWKSADGGKTWLAVARGGRYWLNGADDQYWKSRNNPVGQNTKFAHLQPEMDHKEEMWGNRFLEIGTNGRVYICLDQQVLMSTNGGESWEQIDDNETSSGSGAWVGRGGSNLPGRQLLLETGDPTRYILASGEHGLWQTAALGDYPDKMAVAVEQIEGQIHHGGAHSIASVAVHPKDPKTIYFLVWRQEHRGKLRKSTDGGKTWENIATIFEADNPGYQGVVFQNSLTIDPVNPNNMYFCSTKETISEVHGPNAKKLTKGGFGFYRSFDGGYTWSMSNKGFHEGFSVRRIVMHPDNPNTLYAAVNDVNGGIYKSTDKGSSWKKINTPDVIQNVNNVTIDRNNKYLYISCGNSTATDLGGGVWRSKNDGKSWEKIFDLPFIWQTEVSPINSNILMVSAALPPKAKGNAKLNPGVYLSLDGGETWYKINRNLGQQDRITDIKPDPYREDIFWCAQKGSGWAIGYLKGTTQGWSQK
ncbi:WD40/YVTN/BNR-like repeat-containing protein [Reichenbachiella versicolor]|uniref:WD40/YVTN/BNR-like repeat-containing protein n=1 Tax=Reichenbachiella versicolor TaxID=1821036 RepID=UPI000D6EA7C3|nr:sialidase family protein [Reichenbachiella versicolor]